MCRCEQDLQDVFLTREDSIFIFSYLCKRHSKVFVIYWRKVKVVIKWTRQYSYAWLGKYTLLKSISENKQKTSVEINAKRCWLIFSKFSGIENLWKEEIQLSILWEDSAIVKKDNCKIKLLEEMFCMSEKVVCQKNPNKFLGFFKTKTGYF